METVQNQVENKKPVHSVHSDDRTDDRTVVEYCVCCNSLFDVDPIMQDIIFPICLSCYKNKWGQKSHEGSESHERSESKSIGSSINPILLNI